MSQTPIMEAYPEELYDPSDPTDRQQIEWRGGSGAAAAVAAAEGGAGAGDGEPAAAAEQQQQVEGAALAGDTPPPSVAPPVVSPGGFTVSDGPGYARSATSSGHAAEGGGGGKAVSVVAQLQKDAFLVFRALCKLSIRSTDAAPGSEVTTIRGKARSCGLGAAGELLLQCGSCGCTGLLPSRSAACLTLFSTRRAQHTLRTPLPTPHGRCWRWSC